MHLGAVYQAARRLTRDDSNARDLTQDTMLRAYRAFDTFTPGTNAKAWLLKIVYSMFVNDYHRTRRAPATVTIEELETQSGIQLAGATEVGPDPFGATWSEPAIEAALAELPEPFRMAVLLVDVEELSYEEAARALNCEVGTIRSRLYRARRVLATRLADVAHAHGIDREKRRTR